MSHTQANGPVQEAVRDERAHLENGPVYDDRDYRGHRADNLWLGLGIHLPATGESGGARQRRRRRHRRRNQNQVPDEKQETDIIVIDEGGDRKSMLAPTQRVQFLLQEGEDVRGDHECIEAHKIFTEMGELHTTGQDLEWRETARWIKFEEDVESGGNRWSKPHVGTLSLHSLFELRSCITNGCVILDVDAYDLSQIVDIMLDKLIAARQLDEQNRDSVRDALLKRHTHQYEQMGKARDREGMPHGGSFLQTVRSIAEMGRQLSHAKNLKDHGSEPGRDKKTSTTSGGPPVAQSQQLSLPQPASVPRDMEEMTGVASETTLRPQKSVGFLSPYPKRDSPRASESNLLLKGDQHFMKKIPPGAEASNVLIGEVDFLNQHLSAFIRLRNSVILGDLTEVPVPTRFLFILLGPRGHGPQYREVGRAIATLMCDEIFHDVAYKAHNRMDLLDGVDEFLDQVTVLPPGEWDPSIRIEPPMHIPSQEKRKQPEEAKKDKEEEEEDGGHGNDPTLKRTGRLFGGLILDIKRKAPHYLSDFTDCLNLQCLASFFFMYFALLAPIVTFGGLLDEATGGYMAAIENLLSGAINGCIYHLFSGQPLTIIGSTGPVLVFEMILYDMCKQMSLQYINFRFWVGMWIALILMIMVATDASSLVSFITRFTEECFAALICIIFIYEAITKLFQMLSTDVRIIPYEWPDAGTKTVWNVSCYCDGITKHAGDNNTEKRNEWLLSMVRKYKLGDPYKPLTALSFYDGHELNFSAIPLHVCEPLEGKLYGGSCYRMYEVFLLAVVLAFGTFTLAYALKLFRNSYFFPTRVRQIVSDFAVMLAILSMVGVDYYFGLATPKLKVPSEFKPTLAEKRGWIIDPFGPNDYYTVALALPPALLACVLLFMDQQITTVIVNRKENKLKKGCGYHLDLFVLAILVAICAAMGLPYFVAATVMSLAHVNSLRVESECTAPGEKPTFVGVREQRVTGFIVFLFIGLSVLMTPVLKMIPMAVLYGVFMYMGISALRGIQMVDRMLLWIMPMKYQPDSIYIRHVPIRRIHLFTVFQVGCLASLWIVKNIKATSITFPIMLVFMVGVRKLMEWVFTPEELKYLDDPMPEIHLLKREDARKLKQKEAEEEEEKSKQLATVQTESNLHIPLASGNVMKIPLGKLREEPEEERRMNISEEVNKSGLWKHINSETNMAASMDKGQKQRLSEVPEPKQDSDDEWGPVTIKIDRASPAPGDRRGDEQQVPLLSKPKQPGGSYGLVKKDSKDDSKHESSV